ncbi:hypothetical protein [Capybara microvirus Cap1_SP_59]|nr:hypothetical protein [Capybara microvirus Cap1_SP_59]
MNTNLRKIRCNFNPIVEVRPVKIGEDIDIRFVDPSASDLPSPDSMRLERLLSAGYRPEQVSPAFMTPTAAHTLEDMAESAINSIVETSNNQES